MNHEQLLTVAATTAHEAIRAVQALGNEPDPSPEREHLPTWKQDGMHSAVKAALTGSSPQDLHTAWVADRRARGWTHGPVKNPEAKTHPCLVKDWHDLPYLQRLKDVPLVNITLAMFSGENA